MNEKAAERSRARQPEPHPKLVDFLMADYWKKVDYLSNHFTRVWTCFNFFLTLEAGLSTALWVWFKDKGTFVDTGLGIPLIGLVCTTILYFFGAQDRYLVGVYRGQIVEAAAAVKQELALSDDYIFVGDPDHPGQLNEIYQWQSQVFNTTRLAAWLPLVVVLYWAVMVIQFAAP